MNKIVNIIELELEDFCTILLRINWIAILVGLIFMCIIPILIKNINNFINKKSMSIEEFDLGIGNSMVKLVYNKKDQEVAYKLWVELSTRKIGLPFDEENDVIVQVYDSWYEFFKIARETLKEIPAEKISSSNDLITLTEKVLNDGLRPHLTKWQARFRSWYSNESVGSNLSPQEIQKQYPDINLLISELKETNEHMIEYKRLMSEIAFKK